MLLMYRVITKKTVSTIDALRFATKASIIDLLCRH